MKFDYDNYGKEAGQWRGSWTEADVANLPVGSNWTAAGGKALQIWFRGTLGNSVTSNDKMYVALDDGTHPIAVSVYPDINDIKKAQWQQWNIDLEDFNSAGVDLTNVSKAHIGFGHYERTGQSDHGGQGTVYFDDIQLYLGEGPQLVPVDIKPGSCPNPLNVKSKGVLPVAILGSEDFDVTTIDVASIRLADVSPIRSSCEDVAAPVIDGQECECTTEGPDGYLDLTLKFKTQEIVQALGEVVNGEVLFLTLTGELSDETPIEGADCIVIRGRHKPINPADINKDGVVNAVDFAIFAQNWLQSIED
jgi:hypothetical protein